MPCRHCIDALESAAHALREMETFEPELLPPMPHPKNWTELATSLVEVAGLLRLELQRERGLS